MTISDLSFYCICVQSRCIMNHSALGTMYGPLFITLLLPQGSNYMHINMSILALFYLNASHPVNLFCWCILQTISYSLNFAYKN